jgi:hypothetical protein
LQEPGLFGPASVLPDNIAPIVFEADIKDASLATLHSDLLALGRSFRQIGQAAAADAVSRALAFVRRSASLPIGFREAREIPYILHDGDDEVDMSVRALFRPKMALRPLAAAADLVPEFGAEARPLIQEIETRVTAWDDETPVSAKLARVLEDDAWNGATTTLVIPDRRMADVYLSSDRALDVRCQITDVRGLAERLIARYTAAGVLTASLPTRHSLTPGSPPSRRGLARTEQAASAKHRPALTASAPGVLGAAQLGTVSSSRAQTKKPVRSAMRIAASP